MTDLRRSDSTPEQRVKSTTDLAISWMRFAYRVATGELTPGRQLTDEIEREARLPSVALNHCVRDKRNAKIRTLFTLRDPTWSSDYRDTMTPDVALGSMLHVMQDSFSPAHTCRAERKAEDGLYAEIVDVENYTEQDENGAYNDRDNGHDLRQPHNGFTPGHF